MSGKTRTLFLGLDACDPEIVRAMAVDGELPVLGGLLAGAARGRYDNEAGFFVGSVWPTLMTGTPVDQHHWFTGTAWRPEFYDYVPHDLAEPTVWERLHNAGKRVAVFDAPHVRPVVGLNGVQVCEWGCHDRQYGTASWPAELVSELDSLFGAHPIGTVVGSEDPRHSPCDFVHRAGAVRTAAEEDAFFADVVTGIERKAAASVHLLDRSGWDLFYSVLGEAHCGGHHLWHRPERLREVYRRLDAVVGAHLRRLGPDDTAYVLLSHGMQAHYDGTHVLPSLLHRLSVAFEGDRVGAWSRLPGGVGAAVLRAAGPVVKAMLHGRSVAPVDGELPPLWERAFLPIDNNTVSGAVRLNLVGRERFGRVAADDADRALSWLEQRLRELVNVETGRPVVREVLRVDRQYRRREGDPLPDLFIEWNRDDQINKVWSPTVGLLAAEYAGARTGDHRRGGLLLAVGPGLHAGEVAISPLDVVPVLAASLGVETPGLAGEAVPSLVPRSGAAAVGSQGLGLLGGRRRRRSVARPAAPPPRDLERVVDGLLEAHHETRQLALAAREGVVAAEVVATMAFVKSLEVAEGPLVSVVMATRNRRERVLRAVDSVLRQTYRNVEVVVVDDGSDDDTWEHVLAVEDPRVRPVRLAARSGTNAARNRGLEAARGDVVAYLDDDNTFDPDWVKSVVWAFEQHRDRSVLYGARVVDNVDRHLGLGAGGLPRLQLLDWDRAAVREANRVDINVLAHRRSDTRFDESGAASLLGDWDVVLQLTESTEPLRLPVIAAYYTTDAPDRMTTSDPALLAEQVEAVREKWRGR